MVLIVAASYQAADTDMDDLMRAQGFLCCHNFRTQDHCTGIGKDSYLGGKQDSCRQYSINRLSNASKEPLFRPTT